MTVTEFFKIVFYGLRFDVSTAIEINSIFILIVLFPSPERFQPLISKTANYLFTIVNAIGLIINLSDAANFRYSGKRSSFYFIKANVSEDSFLPLLWKYLYDSWYLLLTAIIIIYVIYKIIFRIKRPGSGKITSRIAVIYFLFYLLLALAFWGRIDKESLQITEAAQHVKSQHIPLVINSPFTVMSSFGKLPADQSHYFPDKECLRIFNPVHPVKNDSAFKDWNVVIIIMESIGEEYTGLSGLPTSYTPFLDSLSKCSLIYTNAYANAHRSIEGIPAVLASIPNMSEVSYLNSAYSMNNVTSIANTLAMEGYYSAFFHGGSNGSMGFDTFSRNAGFKKYYGKNEYPNPRDFDGHWGIFDEPYLLYVANTISTFSQPFAVCEFTLSSHHPYTLPPAYKGKFKGNEFQQTIAYTDHALRSFFREAQKHTWYKNTLFIITSDHTSNPTLSHYRTDEGTFRIPLIFYKDNEPALHSKKITAATQQIDILPTVLSLMNYPNPYFSFGKDAIKNTDNKGAVLYQNYLYQYVDTIGILQVDGKKPIAYFNKTDTFCTNNLLRSVPASKMNYLKAWLQQYNEALTLNKMK
jgi:glucan phosphoethanolaminetransferase (alkaline phosphatase superfamily)